MQKSSRVCLGSLLFAFALDAAASSASIVQGTYKLKPAYEQGDATPVVGPVFKVFSESAERYDFVGETNRNLDFLVTATAFCSSPRREGKIVAEIAGVSKSESKRTKLGRGAVVGETFRLSVPHSKLKAFDAVQACNDGLRTLAAQSGLSKTALIRSGFALRYEDVFNAGATASCSGGAVRGHFRSDETPLDVWVDCAPNPRAASRAREKTGTSTPGMPPPKATGPLITARVLEAESPNRIGTCPALVKFSGRITVTRAGEVTYRYVGHDGSRSPAMKLRFDTAGTHATRSWTITVRLPEPAPGSRALAVADEEPLPRISGWQRIEILEPARHAPSARAEYRITCVEEPLQFDATPVEPADSS